MRYLQPVSYVCLSNLLLRLAQACCVPSSIRINADNDHGQWHTKIERAEYKSRHKELEMRTLRRNNQIERKRDRETERGKREKKSQEMKMLSSKRKNLCDKFVTLLFLFNFRLSHFQIPNVNDQIKTAKHKTVTKNIVINMFLLDEMRDDQERAGEELEGGSERSRS